MYLQKSHKFITQLLQNNNREWFNANKRQYIEAKEEFEHFIETLIPIIQGIDAGVDVTSAKDCMFRIFRDVRFSKNKLPYKTNFGAFIARGGRRSPFAGYYVHFEPDKSFVGGGTYMPESRYLRAIRTEIYENPENFKKLLRNSKFTTYFKGVYGERLKIAPRDFPKDFADIDLLKYKHYAVVHNVNDFFWASETLIDQLIKIFRAQFPFNNFLNNIIEKEMNR